MSHKSCRLRPKTSEFEALKKKLLHEGLFDESKKQSIPRYPRRVGVVSSPSGAAILDFIPVLKLRMPMIEIILFPALVQGEGAKSLVKALQQTTHYDCDVIVVTRVEEAPKIYGPSMMKRL